MEFVFFSRRQPREAVRVTEAFKLFGRDVLLLFEKISATHAGVWP